MPHDEFLNINSAGMHCFPISITPDHQMLVYDKIIKNIAYKRADELVTGNELAYPVQQDIVEEINDELPNKTIRIYEIVNHPRLMEKDGKVKIGSSSNRYGKLFAGNNSKWVPNEISLDSDLYELIGYFLAEGSFGYQNGYPYRLGFCFHIEETLYIERTLYLLNKIFGIIGLVYNKPENHKVIIEANSVPVSMLFYELCGSNAESKRISQLLYPASRDCWIKLLKGYIRGDGSYKTNKQITISSISLYLLSQVRDILLVFGIISSYKKKKLSSKTRHERQGWNLDISSTSGRLLFSLIEENLPQWQVDHQHGHLHRKNRFWDGYFLSKIDSIAKDQWRNEVYDLEVENDHSFAGVPGIIYHNSEAAFWQHPIRHFLKPAYQMTKEQLGARTIPEHVRLRYEVEDYFDRLKYMKYQMLGKAAVAIGDQESAKEFKNMSKRTLFGLNPYGSLSDIFSALPTLERDYFEEFAVAQSKEERQRISELIPPNERVLYQAQWDRKEAIALRAQRDMGIRTLESEERLQELSLKRTTEGRPVNQQLAIQYQSEAKEGETFAEWSRKKELEEYFKERPLPGPDWVGWHPHADLDDVKLKLIDNLGEDIHDYNLWESRRQSLIRKPYIDEEAVSQVADPSGANPRERVQQIEATLRQVLALEQVQVTVAPSGDNFDSVNINILDDKRNAFATYKRNPEFFNMVK